MSNSALLDPRASGPPPGDGATPSHASIFRTSDVRFGSDFILGALVRTSAAIVLLMLAALVAVLIVGAWPSIRAFGFHFVTSANWNPEHQTIKMDANGNSITDATGNDEMVTVPGEFGALPFIYGTIVSSALALILAVPLSLGAALFLVRIGPWLTPTLIKSGLLGILFTFTLAILGAKISGLLAVVGAIVGLIGLCGLGWLTWRIEDPRKSPNPILFAILHGGVPLIMLLLLRMEHFSWLWALVWAGAAAAVLGELGRGGVNILSFLIEFLAAIPSIAYGLWGLFVVVPFLAGYIEPSLNRFFGALPFIRVLSTEGMPSGRDMFAAGLILAIMVLPIITAISRDVLRAVPQIQIEGTQALGATWWQSSWAMFRYSRSGLFGAIMLGLARAAGETMAVTMVIGNMNRINFSIFEKGQTMSSLLANEFKETSAPMQVSALIEVGLVLLLMSLTFNIVARYLVVGNQPRAGGS